MDYMIRRAKAADAAQIVAHMQAISDEPNNGILRSLGEYTRTPEELRQILEDMALIENAMQVVAEWNGEIIGYAGVHGGTLKADRHTAAIGISIKAEFRDKGVGTGMMQFIIEWGRQNPRIHRLELGVFANNARAIHVYEKLGFQREGVKRQVFLKDGAFVDLVEMGLIFDKPLSLFVQE